VIGRLREQRGQASTELLGMLPIIFLTTLVLWQLCLATWTVNQVSNAARTASRVAARDGDYEKAARNSLSRPLQKNLARVELDGEKATVKVRMPIVVPGLSDRRIIAQRTATLPE